MIQDIDLGYNISAHYMRIKNSGNFFYPHVMYMQINNYPHIHYMRTKNYPHIHFMRIKAALFNFNLSYHKINCTFNLKYIIVVYNIDCAVLRGSEPVSRCTCAQAAMGVRMADWRPIAK